LSDDWARKHKFRPVVSVEEKMLAEAKKERLIEGERTLNYTCLKERFILKNKAL
jgi:hypothetical protein